MEKIRHEVWKLSREKPDFAYCPSNNEGKYLCSYNSGPTNRENGNPVKGWESEGCIFGQAIKRADPEFFNTIKNDSLEIRSILMDRRFFSDICEEDIQLAQDIQKKQDYGITWGDLPIPSSWSKV